MTSSQPKPQPSLSDREKKLRMLVDNNLIEEATMYLEEHELPFLILPQPDGRHIVRSIYTEGEQYLNRFITIDPEMLSMKEDALKVSHTPYEVLVWGETGTGKDIISCSQINNREGQLKVVNCSGLPRDLIESELFGHVKGAFTSADKEKEGLIAAANDGVMFLDEIGDMPLDVQAKLLRAIQYKVIRKVGSNKEEKITCKFVCATNKNLPEMVKKGEFREDLYARLSTLELHITPLRERLCDVEPICNSLEGGKEFYREYGKQVMDGLLDLSLNVRSLQQYIIRFSVLGKVRQMKGK